MRDTSQEFLLEAEKVKKKEEVSSLRGIVNLSSLAFSHISNSSPLISTLLHPVVGRALVEGK